MKNGSYMRKLMTINQVIRILLLEVHGFISFCSEI